MDRLSHSMVVGVYQSPEIARQTINELVKSGYPTHQIHVRARISDNLDSTAADQGSLGLYDNIKGDLDSFFRGMTDGDSHTEILSEYARVLDAGNTLVSVDADNDVEANKAAVLMSKNATVASEHTATSPKESDISNTGSWDGVKIFKSTKNSLY